MNSPSDDIPLSFAKWIDKLTQSIALVGFFGLFIMGLLIFYDGAARYLGVPRISGFPDYGEVIFPLVIASCFPAGLFRQTNVTVRILGKVSGNKINSWLETFASLVTLIFFSILAWELVKLTLQYGEAHRITRTIGIPLAPWWWFTTAIMLVCVPIQAIVFSFWLWASLFGVDPVLKSLNE